MTLLVRNLTRATRKMDILALCEAGGTVESCMLVFDTMTRQSTTTEDRSLIRVSKAFMARQLAPV